MVRLAYNLVLCALAFSSFMSSGVKKISPDFSFVYTFVKFNVTDHQDMKNPRDTTDRHKIEFLHKGYYLIYQSSNKLNRSCLTK